MPVATAQALVPDLVVVPADPAADALGPPGPSGFGARLLDRLVSLYFEH